MHQITFSSRFTLTFKVRHSQVKAIDKILSENKYQHVLMVRMPFDAWYEYRVDCNLRTGYALKELVKNFKVYE